jgi:hypothetical protein
MARQEKDREDLMAEARNFVARCELRVPGEQTPVVAGFRRDGRLSIYFGPDPVYHFDTAGRIRRAFVAEHLFKAEWGRLVQLRRRRTPEATYLDRHEMSEAETVHWLEDASRRLDGLRKALDAESVQVLRQVPDDADLTDRLRATLEHAFQAPLKLASSARSL